MSSDYPEQPAQTNEGRKLPVWEQQMMADNCVVEAERFIINLFAEHPLSQQEAMQISASYGWYRPGHGTSPEHLGCMLNLFGIPNHSVAGASVADLANELAQGHGVIVPVDSHELWDNGPFSDLRLWLSSNFNMDFGDPCANHAIVVAGIDVSNPGNPIVIINDSGVPNGEGQPYSMQKFLEAWKDGNCSYTATDIPLPEAYLQGTRENMELALTRMSDSCGLGSSLSSIIGGLIGVYSAFQAYDRSGDLTDSITTGFTRASITAQVTSSIIDAIFSNNS